MHIYTQYVAIMLKETTSLYETMFNFPHIKYMFRFMKKKRSKEDLTPGFTLLSLSMCLLVIPVTSSLPLAFLETSPKKK